MRQLPRLKWKASPKPVALCSTAYAGTPSLVRAQRVQPWPDAALWHGNVFGRFTEPKTASAYKEDERR